MRIVSAAWWAVYLVAGGTADAEVRVLEESGSILRLEYRSAATCPRAESALVGIPPGAEPRMVVVEAESTESRCDGVDGGGEPARMGGPGWIRHQQASKVVFNPEGGYRRVEVELDMPEGDPPPAYRRQESPIEAAFYDRLLVNPDSARPWRTAPSPLPAARAAAAGSWYRLTVTESGIYRVRADELPGWQGAASSGLALYATGAEPLRPSVDRLPAERRPVAVVVYDGGDGRFDGDDELLFFGDATSSWVVDEDDGLVWRHNPFTDLNQYWLATDNPGGARRLPVRNGDPDRSEATEVTTYFGRKHIEVESSPRFVAAGNIPSGKEWYWLSLTPGQEEELTPALTFPAGGILRLRIKLISRGSVVERLRVRWNERTVGSAFIRAGGTAIWEGRVPVEADASAAALGLIHVSGARVLLDWYELGYERRLQAISGQLRFEASPGDSRYHSSGFVESPLVFAIDGGGGLAAVIAARHDPLAGTVRFVDDGQTAQPPLRLAVVERNCLRAPVAIAAIEHPDRLLKQYEGADYVVITPPEFAAAAQRLADWRSTSDQFGPPLTTAVVDVESIYDALNGGLLDPTAIRNFLRWAFQLTPAPRFVVLLGDGSYDYRDNTGAAAGANWIPPYEERDSTYDEFFARVAGNDALADMAIGRLPVRSAAQAETVVDKIIGYERQPENGIWRSRVLLVADDTFNSDRPATVEAFFTVDTEALATVYLFMNLDVQKVYLVEYPREDGTKPRAREAFLDAFNEGAVVLTWVGHGNSRVFAHEHIFVLPGDLASLHNGRRLPFVYAAASQMGVFDDPSRDSVPDALLSLPGGGVIGMIAATRIGIHVSNMELARLFQARLFDRGWRQTITVGEALWEAKLLTASFPENVRRYSLFGDPATRLAFPEMDVALAVPDTLRALGLAHVEGQVLRGSGTAADFEGEVRLQVFDSWVQRRRVEQGRSMFYVRPGAVLFRGRYPVRSGRFALDVPIPLDVTYGGRGGRVSALVFGGGASAFGAVSGLEVSGPDLAASDDGQGPRIDIGFRDRSFRAGGPVPAGSTLRLVLRDDDGINIAGDVGHGIRLLIDAERFDVTGDYVAQGDYRVGEILFPLPDLAVGEHRVEAEAWDTRNNWASASTRFVLSNAAPLAQLLYHPNPQTDRDGSFAYRLQAAADGVRIRVYTVSGRRVDTVQGPAEAGANQVPWPVPESLANGVYLFAAEILGGPAPGRARGVLVVAR